MQWEMECSGQWGQRSTRMKQNRRIFLRNTVLTGGAITLRSLAGNGQTQGGIAVPPVSAGPEATNGALVRQQFQNPPKKYRPIVRWWWPGNDVTEAELRR